MSRKLRLVHVQVLPILSGVQKVTLNLFRNLDKTRYDLYLICGEPENGMEPALITESEALGVKVIQLQELKRKLGFHDIKAFFALLQVFKKYDFDIIHTHTSKTGFLGRIAGKLSGCRKVIHTVHGIAFHQYETPLKKCFYILLEMVAGLFNDKVVLVNKFYRSKFWFIPARKIMTIYNSIDYNELQPKKRRSDGIIKFISVGRLDRQKSPMNLLIAMRILCTKRQDVSLSIVGDGEYYNRMESYIAENDMQDKVILMGWQNDVPQLLSEHDIFVNSPIYEAFGLVFCEAGYTGLPVISTNVEGIPEVVEQDETGILVPPQDPEALAEAMLYLAENKEVATRMGEKARQIIRKKFDLSLFIQEYTKLYELH